MPQFTPSDTAELAAHLAHRCEDPHPYKQGWRARCPAHQGASQTSLALTPDTDRVLLHCFAGCAPATIVAAMGLTLADLFVKPKASGQRQIQAVYDYATADGTLLFQTVRYIPKDFRQRRPDPAHPQKYIWNLNGIDLVLYRLPELHEALCAEQTIYVVEGEKDADTLGTRGLAATCNPLGAGKWQDRYSETLRGAQVVILPDNDAPGRTHAQHVATSLAGKAASIKVLTLSGLPEKGDVSDWLTAGGTREALEALVRETPAWSPAHALPTDETTAPPGEHCPMTPHALTPLHSFKSFNSSGKWPHMAAEAFCGLAGHLCTLLSPHTEADDVALLIQFLAYFGTMIGRAAHYQVEATRHYTNIYACLVGKTAKARKGTSYDHIDNLMRRADPSWSLSNMSGGCGSGEGVIAAVRDTMHKREPIKQQGRIVGYQEVEVDPGVRDKRLLIQEAEFASVLKIAAREGNTLSMILRHAWDTGTLRNTVKHNPLTATGAHIAVVGHITQEELRRHLSSTEMANGFGNRFLWLCVKRSKLLPDGGALDTVDLAPLVRRLQAAVAKAKGITRMQRNAEARAAWHAVYPVLSADRPGLLGAMTARAEAQTLRLACLYALLDGTDTMTATHLYAALAVWEYAEASVAYIFGDATGDPVVDPLLAALRDCYPNGLTRKQINDEVFGRNRRADEIARAVASLLARGVVTVQEETNTGGRPSQTVLYNPAYELNDLNELSPSSYLALAQEAVEEHRRQHRVAVLTQTPPPSVPAPPDVPARHMPGAAPLPAAPPPSTVGNAGHDGRLLSRSPCFVPAAGMPRAPAEACPQCGGRTWAPRLTYRLCAGCGYRDGPTPGDILGPGGGDA